MQVMHKNIQIQTNGKGTYPITRLIRSTLQESKITQGLVNVFVQHTSCSLVLMENADPEARMDLNEYFNRLVPENEPYFLHTCEGPDDMPSHIRMVLTGCSESIPIIDGQLSLGIWQGVFVFEHRNTPQLRSVIITVMGV